MPRELLECRFCGAEVDVVEEFAFLMECERFEEEFGPIEYFQASSAYYGEPLRMCGDCRAGITSNQSELAAERKRNTEDGRRWGICMGLVLGLLLGVGSLLEWIY